MKEGIDKVVTETTPAKRWADPTEIGEVIAVFLHCMHIDLTKYARQVIQAKMDPA